MSAALMCILLQAGEEAAEAEPTPGPDDPQPLTEEEEQEKEQLLKKGFSNWSRRDFSAFTRACEKVLCNAFRFFNSSGSSERVPEELHTACNRAFKSSLGI